jgi:hypothetical protein
MSMPRIGPGIAVLDANRCGRRTSMCSISIGTGRRPVPVSARNRAPAPIGSPVSSSTRCSLGLYAGSFRSSATTSNTTVTGRSIAISPRSATHPPPFR